MLALPQLLRLRWSIALSLLVGAGLPVQAASEGGRIEINQASVDAAGGFPHALVLSGSYVLTGDLVVPGDTDGLLLGADGIALDLNGFRVRGASSCTPGACATGFANGISALAPFGVGASLRDGTVSGFSGDCVSVGTNASVANLLVSECGGRGIRVDERGMATSNRVQNTGAGGIVLAPSALAAHNVVAGAALADGVSPAFAGGAATAGNYCDDGSCSRLQSRRYYLTPQTFAGNHGANVCTPGFHMASITELTGASALVYDPQLGFTQGDSGAGAPTNEVGWVRSGGAGSSLTSGENCWNPQGPWTTNSFLETGSAVSFAPPASWSAAGTRISPLLAPGRACNQPARAWCVED